MKQLFFGCILMSYLWVACGTGGEESGSGLPFYGEKTVVQKSDGTIDSLPYTVPDFSFINQDGETVTQDLIKGKVYLVDFFFTHCPSICPRVKKNTIKVQEKFKDRDDFLILSHSIDTKYDTVERLAWFADKIGIDTEQWHLLTGNKDDIYSMSAKYFISAMPDSLAPGGYNHSSYIALVDRHRRIRKMYDGLDEDAINNLIADTEKLLATDE